MASDKDILAEAKEAFALAEDAFADNRDDALDDLRFARLSEQWPEDIKKKRMADGRPMLTINRLPAFIRQVVNDARQNKPAMAAKPLDSRADIKTAEVLGGLLKAIEIGSNADIAYDTAVDFATSCGFGYWRIDIDYVHNDGFDKCLKIKRIANPFSVYGDPHSVEADSSDWNSAFVTSMMPMDEFTRLYKGAETVDWDSLGYGMLDEHWRDGEELMVAEWWTREEVARKLLLLTDGTVIDDAAYEQIRPLLEQSGNVPVNERPSKGYKITQRLMTGAEVLNTTEWAGKYIPIVPVYGEELNVEGKRYFRSLIRDSKDAQRMFNYWRTVATETVALAPRAPWIGPEEAFEGADRDKWLTANTENHAYLAYNGQVPPQRQAIDSGPAAGAMMEASQAADDLKSIMGIYDASLGARSNETSGKAIMARQREGDISTFHIIDNLNRAIRHSGRILVDLIPKVYTGERIVRIVDPDGEENAAMLTQGMDPNQPPPIPEGVIGIYDVSAGKYDIVVDSGPSFTTRREEAAEQMMMLTQANPSIFSVIGDKLVENLDWPGAQKIAERLKRMVPPEVLGDEADAPAQPEVPPEMQMAMEQLQQDGEAAGQAAMQAQAELEQAKQENTLLKQQAALDKKAAELDKRAVELENQLLKAQAQVGQQIQTAQERQPVDLAQTLAEVIAPVFASALQQALVNLPPLRVEQPPPIRMKRTPVRDKRGLIMHTIDEPIVEETLN